MGRKRTLATALFLFGILLVLNVNEYSVFGTVCAGDGITQEPCTNLERNCFTQRDKEVIWAIPCQTRLVYYCPVGEQDLAWV